MNGKDRLKELVVYVASKSAGDRHFGAVKLNKILLNADQYQYARTGGSISGQVYKKHQNGPAPADMVAALRELESSGSIRVRELPAGRGMTRKAILAQREASLAQFTGEDVAVLDEMIEELKGIDSNTLSMESHGPAWENADLYEEIPLSSIFFPLGYSPTESDRERSLELMSEHSWSERYGWAVS